MTRRDQSPRKVAVFIAFTAVVGLVAGFIVLETAYRAYQLYAYGMIDYPDLETVGAVYRDEQYGLLPTPNFRFDMIPDKVRFHPGVDGFQADVTFNRWGYRGADFSKDKPPGTFRIVTFGGSTTMSIESDEANTWPALLQKFANERGSGRTWGNGASSVEVINAGIGASRTREGLLRLKNEVQYFQPDLILVAYGWNDVFRGVSGDDPHAAASVETPWWYQSAVLQNLRARYLARTAQDARYHDDLITRLRRDSPWSKAYVTNLLEMHRVASSIGARMILVNLPGLCRKESRETSEYDVIISRSRVTPENFDFWVEVKSFEGALLADVAATTGMPLVDVSAAFDKFSGVQRLELFEDEMHLSDAGAREVAEAINRAMASGI